MTCFYCCVCVVSFCLFDTVLFCPGGWGSGGAVIEVRGGERKEKERGREKDNLENATVAVIASRYL